MRVVQNILNILLYTCGNIENNQRLPLLLIKRSVRSFPIAGCHHSIKCRSPRVQNCSSNEKPRVSHDLMPLWEISRTVKSFTGHKSDLLRYVRTNKFALLSLPKTSYSRITLRKGQTFLFIQLHDSLCKFIRTFSFCKEQTIY